MSRCLKTNRMVIYLVVQQNCFNFDKVIDLDQNCVPPSNFTANNFRMFITRI